MSTFVYAIRAGDTGYVKFGASRDPRKRLRSLQTGSHLPLRLVAQARDARGRFEYQLHHLIFNECHTTGEWFDVGEMADSALRSVFAALDMWDEATRAEKLLIVATVVEMTDETREQIASLAA